MGIKIDCETYWQSIPVGRENSVSYRTLCARWGRCERSVRQILQALSRYDNGDNYVLIRSSRGGGFYKTDDHTEIEQYRQECLNRGRNIFAAISKCNRILENQDGQMSLFDVLA